MTVAESNRPVVVSAVRTAIGTAYKGTLADTPPEDLAVAVVGEAARRSGTADEVVDWLPATHPETADAPAYDMSIPVGFNTAVRAGLTREELDAWALRSHQRAVHAR